MARKHSYTITHSNYTSEKEAIQFLTNSESSFIHPDKESRKRILELMEIDKKFSRAFDLVQVEGHNSLENVIEIQEKSKITLIELKTTKKKLPNNPRGFFFGATENEFELARRMGGQFKFCFVSLHPESLGYELLTLIDLESIIRTKRIQYQINLKA